VPQPAAPTLSGFLEQVFALAGWSSTPWLATIRRPTLVLAGEDDPLAPVTEARALAAAIPNAALELFDCGHLFVATRRERVLASIECFLLQSTHHRPEGEHG
jgi:pimeloyl-ACP methyl ester carboxylesterase